VPAVEARLDREVRALLLLGVLLGVHLLEHRREGDAEPLDGVEEALPLGLRSSSATRLSLVMRVGRVGRDWDAGAAVARRPVRVSAGSCWRGMAAPGATGERSTPTGEVPSAPRPPSASLGGPAPCACARRSASR
jgi:hypothetical protein